MEGILWLDPMASDNAVSTRFATIKAVVRWARGTLDGLRENGVEVVVI